MSASGAIPTNTFVAVDALEGWVDRSRAKTEESNVNSTWVAMAVAEAVCFASAKFIPVLVRIT